MTQYITLPKRAKDMTGQRFNRLVALGPVELGTHKHIVWSCQCDCGDVIQVRSDMLRNGHVKSCGCFNSEVHSALWKKHGMSRTQVYRVRVSMISRCTDPKATGYDRYGGRGIYVCEDWVNSFDAFYVYVSQLLDCSTLVAKITLLTELTMMGIMNLAMCVGHLESNRCVMSAEIT